MAKVSSKGPLYRRVLLKMSGEMLAGNQSFGIEPKALRFLAGEIAAAHREGVEIAIVPGGGNILRGAQASGKGMDRVTADYIGMLATLINSLNLVDALRQHEVDAEVLNAFSVGDMVDPYRVSRAEAYLKEKKVVILSGGTGNPMLSTDTAAALRARELSCEAVIKGTKVEGVCEADPAKVKSARLLSRLTYKDVLGRGLKVMDLSAIALCEEGGLPVHVFNFRKRGNLVRVLRGDPVGTLVE